MTRTDTYPRRRGLGYWAMIVLAVIMLLIGLVLLAGGIWLISLGGSWYYALAGIGLIVSALLMMRRDMLGLWVYVLTYILTVIWALWEAGLNGWAQVPRLVAPTVILILVLLCIPVLRNGREDRRYGGRPAGAVAGIAALAAGLALFHSYAPQGPIGSAVAQTVTPETPATTPAQPAPDAAPQPAPQQPAPAPTPGEAQSQPQQAPAATPAPTEPSTPPAAAPAGQGAETQANQTAPTADTHPGFTTPPVGSDWPAYGGSIDGKRYSPLDQITRDNVGDLQRVWIYHTGDMPTQPSDEAEDQELPPYAAETTPLKIGDTLYLCSAKGIMIALDAATGLERWRYDPGVSDDAIPYNASCRGVAYYAIPNQHPIETCATRIMEGTLDARLIAVDARTGQPCPDFGVNGQVNLLDGIGYTVPGWYAVTSAPTIVRDVVVMGAQVSDNEDLNAPSGVVRGYNAVTGELEWAWDMMRPGETDLPPQDEVYTRGTPNMWTTAAGDDELGLVYLPLGNSSVDYYGAERSERENEFSTSLVAIDVTTGEVAWHFQTVHYDLWDYDLGSQPTLVDFPTDNGTVPALVLSSKQGQIYILNRRTGESLFPVEEREVPIGGVEEENLSRTQPFSTYHSLVQPDLVEADMWGMSPIDQLWCRIQFHRAYYEGMYTPPSTDRHYIEYPGYNGGSDWGSLAVDAERGIIIANYNDMPNYNRLVPREEVEALGVKPITEPGRQFRDPPGDLAPQGGAPYGIDVNAGWRVPYTGLLCKQPPYGGIRAIDLATGETIWDRPFGEARRNGPFGIPSLLPIVIGTPNNGGPVITAGGVIFIAATTDDMIRAIDIETGEVLWEDTLPAGGQATPMTYEMNGRQFLVLMAGGHHFMETPIGDAVIAWSLPEDENEPESDAAE